jgi:hypothetical protein
VIAHRVAAALAVHAPPPRRVSDHTAQDGPPDAGDPQRIAGASEAPPPTVRPLKERLSLSCLLPRQASPLGAPHRSVIGIIIGRLAGAGMLAPLGALLGLERGEAAEVAETGPHGVSLTRSRVPDLSVWNVEGPEPRTLANGSPLGYDGAVMDPADPVARPVPARLAPGSQTVCYLPWLKMSVALRYVLSFPWTPDARREVRQHIPWLLAEQDRIRKAGWFN